MQKDTIEKVTNRMDENRRRRLWKKAVGVMACGVVFCTVYGLIMPALTLENTVYCGFEEHEHGDECYGKTLSCDKQEHIHDTSCYIDPTMPADMEAATAHITKAELYQDPNRPDNQGVYDGTAPFENAAGAGKDENSYNRMVRSQDTITYEIMTSYEPDDANTTLASGRIGYEVRLLYDEEVYLDQSAMNWAQDWNETTETGADGQNYRVYTFYRELQESNGVAIPGACTVPVIVKVGNQQEGYKIKPEIKAWCEQAADPSIKTSVSNIPEVTVTSAPKFNVVLAPQKTPVTVSALNEFTIGDKKVMGYEAAFGVGIEIRNDNYDAGMRGTELPDKTKDITFDIDLKSVITQTDDQTNHASDYAPIIRIFKKNGQDNNYISDLPYGDGREEGMQSGEVEYSQEGNVVHVTIKGGTYSCDRFPEKSVGGDTYVVGDQWMEKVFSAYYFTVIIPTKVNDGKDMREEYPNASVTLTAQTKNMQVVSSSGSTTTNQTVTTDDEKAVNRGFVAGAGKHDHEIFYSNPENWTDGTKPGNKDDGSDSAAIGQNLAWTVCFNESEVGSADLNSHVIAFDQLVKFDDEALTVDPEEVTQKWGENTWRHPSYGDWAFKASYAYKTDGSGWGSDDEMKAAKEEDLCYSETYDPERTCVGMLYQWRGCNTDVSSSGFSTLTQQAFKVRSDAEKINEMIDKAYMLVATSNAWTVEDLKDSAADWFAQKGITEPTLGDYKEYSQANWEAAITPQGDKVPVIHKAPSVNVDRDNDYVKANYDENGYLGGETGTWLYGDTLYIVPYTTWITKNIAQTDAENNKKSTYDLDHGQRVADYKVGLKMEFAQEVELDGTWKTEITIIDKLPKGLTYIAGSAYFGGEYTEAAGGDQYKQPGAVTGGRPIEPTEIVSNVEDGSTTLTWKIKDVTVVDGDLPTLHYSCQIGDSENAKNDVTNGASLINSISIQTTEDKRKIDVQNHNLATEAITSSKLASLNIFKDATMEIEANGKGEYNISVNNSGASSVPDICAVDVMPANGVNGSIMQGRYKLTGISIDQEAIGSLDDVTVFYTFTPITDAEKSGLTYDAVQGWSQANLDTETGIISGDLIGQWPTAIAVYDASLESMCSIHIKMEFQGDVGAVDDYLNNAFLIARDQLSMNAHTKVYTRHVSGYAWYDVNQDGSRGQDETPVANMKAVLYQHKEDGSLVEIANTLTTEDGFYQFGITDQDRSLVLLPGDYEIHFENIDDNRYKVTDPTATATDQFGNVTEADKALAEVTNQNTKVIKFHMPEMEEMKTADQVHYDLPEQNIGLVDRSEAYELPETGSHGTVGYIFGGVFLMGLALMCGFRFNRRLKREVSK